MTALQLILNRFPSKHSEITILQDFNHFFLQLGCRDTYKRISNLNRHILIAEKCIVTNTKKNL